MPSRSPLAFIRRSALLEAESLRPAPRLDTGALLVNTVPLVNPQKIEAVLPSYEGAPPPDRGVSRPWPVVPVTDT